jgi:hypothetical protein
MLSFSILFQRFRESFNTHGIRSVKLFGNRSATKRYVTDRIFDLYISGDYIARWDNCSREITAQGTLW